MNSEIKNIFPIPISITKNFLSKIQCTDIRNYFLSKSNLSPHGLLEGNGLTSYQENSDFLEELTLAVPSCRNIKRDIDLLMQQYSFDTGLLHKVIDRSWANIQNKNSSLLPHTHPCSVFTGVIYISVKSPVSPLLLNNPNPFISHTAIVTTTEYTLTKYEVMPSEGMILLFPSWITHWSKNSSSEERIVISFNSGLR